MYWMLIACNIVTPQFLWFRKVRAKVGALFAIAMVVNVGMWLERFVIVVTSLHRDFLPSSWGVYYPTRWDILYVCRNDRPLPVPGVSLPPLLAADFHFRNAHVGGERGREEGGQLMRAARFYFSSRATMR